MSDREGHSSLPPSDDDLSLPKATVAKMITGSFLVVSRPSSGLKISATLTKPPPAVSFYLFLFPRTRTPPTYTLGRFACNQIRTHKYAYISYACKRNACTHAYIHTRACCAINRTPSQRRHLRQGDSRLGHRMLRRSVPDPPHVLIFAELI